MQENSYKHHDNLPWVVQKDVLINRLVIAMNKLIYRRLILLFSGVLHHEVVHAFLDIRNNFRAQLVYSGGCQKKGQGGAAVA